MKKPTRLPIDFDKAKAVSSVLRAIYHPLRMEILQFIDQAQSTQPGTIYKSLAMDQSIISQQLKILRDADIVLYQRSGKEMHYTINYDRIKHICHTVNIFPQVALAE